MKKIILLLSTIFIFQIAIGQVYENKTRILKQKTTTKTITVSEDAGINFFATDTSYYADESYPPVRTDTVPALISYYEDIGTYAGNQFGHFLLVVDGFVLFDVYETGGSSWYMGGNGEWRLKPEERREFIGYLNSKRKQFSEDCKFYDYKLKNEYE